MAYGWGAPYLDILHHVLWTPPGWWHGVPDIAAVSVNRRGR